MPTMSYYFYFKIYLLNIFFLPLTIESSDEKKTINNKK